MAFQFIAMVMSPSTERVSNDYQFNTQSETPDDTLLSRGCRKNVGVHLIGR